jgi:hypothetical protein
MWYRASRPLLIAAVLLTAVGWSAMADAQQPNLTYYYDPGFTYPLVPTNIQFSGPPFNLPAALIGNSDTIFWNFAGHNNGLGATSGDLYGSCWLDGEYTWGWSFGWTMAPGFIYQWHGQGPFNIRGGRHTLGIAHDDPDAIVESDENDNVWAHQFVFTPYVLSEATPKTRGTPPDWQGGWTSIVDGSAVDANCDGFRFSSSGWWNVITLYAPDIMDDYDLELHAPSTGSENGFIGSTCGSYYFGGSLDAVIVNRNTVGTVDYDVGIYNMTTGGGSFVVEQVVSQPAGVGADMNVALGTDEYLRIWDTWIGDTGWVTVSVDDPSADGEDIMVGWAEYDATELSLVDISTWEVTDDNGQARLHRDFTTTGYYGLIVYRYPMDGGAAKTINVKIEPTPPDLRPLERSDWHSPLVPTPISEWIHPIPLPDTLHGFMPETYLNDSLENNSPVAAPPADVGVFQDGLPWYIPFQTTTLAPYGSWAEYDGTGREIPGGRHVLTLDIDHTDSLHEIHEDNNIWGEQYCWSPLELVLGGQYSHFAPGPVSGGWLTISSGETIFANCDGYRLYTGYGDWEGLVLTQGPGSDYDLSVHHALAGVKDGFDDYLIASYFLAGETDYVLFNNNLLPAGVYDIGVENIGGDEPYTVEAVGSTNLPVPVSGHHGPYTMPVAHMLHLYNIFLEQDIHAFRLDNLAGAVDWGISLHAHDEAMSGRNNAMPAGSAYLNGPGDPEWFSLDIPAAGWYGLAVYKTGPFEFDKDGTYQLTIQQGVSDVPEGSDLPVATALAGIHPNPFNPQTTINYELAAPATVELDIYDVKGALVRRLVRESMPAGRHAAVWNGQDDSGARVASGVYLVQFNASASHDIRKLVMLK